MRAKGTRRTETDSELQRGWRPPDGGARGEKARGAGSAAAVTERAGGAGRAARGAARDTAPGGCQAGGGIASEVTRGLTAMRSA